MGLWWDPFIQSRKCMTLKFPGEFCVMTMKNDAKFEEELNCNFKIDMRNLKILTQALKNLKNLYFNGLLLNRVYVWATKKYRGVMFDGTEYWCNIWRKTDLFFLKNFVYRLKNSNFMLESKWQNSIESWTYWFLLKIARIFPSLTGRNR